MAASPITAETKLADLRSLVTSLSRANDDIAASNADIDLTSLNLAFATLKGPVDALTGTTVGNAAATITPAMNQVNTAYTAVFAAAGCE